MGVDPGLARMGYGFIRAQAGRWKMVDCGTLSTPAGLPVEKRLVSLFEALSGLMEKHRPEVMALEQLFFSKNVTTGIVVGQARGVAVLAAGLAKIPVYEYRPAEVKQAVTGYGQADKGQVQKMVKLLLGLVETPKPDDTADALAVALTHAQGGGGAWLKQLKENPDARRTS
jgi:crossover junction endodeoxyribonuclease RuvC